MLENFTLTYGLILFVFALGYALIIAQYFINNVVPVFAPPTLSQNKTTTPLISFSIDNDATTKNAVSNLTAPLLESIINYGNLIKIYNKEYCNKHTCLFRC